MAQAPRERMTPAMISVLNEHLPDGQPRIPTPQELANQIVNAMNHHPNLEWFDREVLTATAITEYARCFLDFDLRRKPWAGQDRQNLRVRQACLWLDSYDLSSDLLDLADRK